MKMEINDHIKISFSCITLYQSCPRVTFLGPDPTRPDPTRWNVDPTWPAIAVKKSDPTRPAARPPSQCTMVHKFRIQVANREQYTIAAWFRGKQLEIFLFRYCNAFRGWKNDLEWSYFSRPWSRGNRKTVKYQMLVAKVHSKFNLNRSKLWSLNSFNPTRFKQTSVTSGKPECQTRLNVYEFNIASTFYQKEIVILNRRKVFIRLG